LGEEDDFFKKFSALDNETYQANVLDKRQKELIGLTISIMSRCEECILYHLEECQKADVTRDEVMEVVKMTVIGGGSVLYPFARKVLKLLDELKYE
jgi:AhpD family alkylhydroperoxidase